MKVEKKQILERGTHLGYEWAMLIGPHGGRNGYVRIPKGHAWHDVGYNDLPAEVHGGITFSGSLFDEDSYWLGFDTAHCDDLPDPELAARLSSKKLQYALEDHATFAKHGATVKTAEYVREHIFRLCEQAAFYAETPVICDKCSGRGTLSREIGGAPVLIAEVPVVLTAGWLVSGAEDAVRDLAEMLGVELLRWRVSKGVFGKTLRFRVKGPLDKVKQFEVQLRAAVRNAR